MIPRIPSRKKGDPYTAADQRKVARAINTIAKGLPESFESHGSVYDDPPFEPIFFYSATKYYVRVSQSKKGGKGTMGNTEWSVPYFESAAIVNDDLNDPTWAEPKKEMSDGDWEMWLVEGVAATAAASTTIIVQKTSVADPESKPPWKNVYKLATWTVSTTGGVMSATDIETITAASIEDNPAPYPPFYPVIWHDGTNFKAFFTPAQVLHYKTGSAVDVTVNSGVMADSTGETITNGESWYVNITTNTTGTPTAADLQSATTPTNTQFEEPLSGSGTAGDYWFKVCTFNVDGDGRMIPTMEWTGNMPWNPRPWQNVGAGEKVVKDFANGIYSARTLTAKDSDPGTSETLSGSTKIYDVYVNPAENGDVVEFTGKVEIPDPSTSAEHPWKVTDAGAGSAAIAAGFINGYYFTYAEADPENTPLSGGPAIAEDIVKAPISSYAGGNQAITGTQYIYAETDRNYTNLTTDEYAEDDGAADVLTLVELFDEMDPANYTSGAPADTCSIVASSSAPHAYSPTTGKAAVCIAKVVNAAGVLTITQYITHNPDLFIPRVLVTNANAGP